MALSGLPRREADRALLAFVAKVFAQTNVRGAIIGGIARNLWAVPRLTFDLDFTVVADPDAERAFVDEMVAAGFTLVREQAAMAPSGPDFLQLYNTASQHVVEFQAAKTPYQELLIQRSITVEGLEPLRVATREDLIVLKLLAFRDKDQDDLRLIAAAEGLDWEYIETWSHEWQTDDRLALLRGMLAPLSQTPPPNA